MTRIEPVLAAILTLIGYFYYEKTFLNEFTNLGLAIIGGGTFIVLAIIGLIVYIVVR